MSTSREIDSHTSPVTTDISVRTDLINAQIKLLNEQLRLFRGAIEEMQSVVNAAVDRATQGDAFSSSSYRRWTYLPPRLPKNFWPAPIDCWEYDLHGNRIRLRGQHRRVSGR